MKRSKYGNGFITGNQPRSKKNLLLSLSYTLLHMVPVNPDKELNIFIDTIVEIIQKSHHTKKRKIARFIRSINYALITETLCDSYGNPLPLYMYASDEVKDEFKKCFSRSQIAAICQDKHFTIFQEKYWVALRALMITIKQKLAEPKEEKVVQ